MTIAGGVVANSSAQASQAQSARTSSAIFIDGLLPTIQTELSGKDGVSVSIVGLRSHLFIGGKKFRCLKAALREVRRCVLKGGEREFELHVRGEVAANDSASGTLRITFPPAAALTAAEAWAILQFESDLKLTMIATWGATKSLADIWPDAATDLREDVCREDVTVPKWLKSVRFKGGTIVDTVRQHPEELLEAEAVRNVQLPDLDDLELSLPAQVVISGQLSAPQLQAVCYAARAFNKAVGGGFLLGDGTGCGKGRVIAALMVHQATKPFAGGSAERIAEIERRRCHGRARRCLWVSSSRDLAKDAERDLGDIGALAEGLKICESAAPRLDAAECKAKESDAHGSGNIMFVTYAKLRNIDSARRIVEWLGADLA